MNRRLSFGIVRSGLVPEKAFLRLFFAYLEFKARDRGEFVHHNHPPLLVSQGCPHCGCQSYFAFCHRNRRLSLAYAYLATGDDAFECAACGAVRTRRDTSPFGWNEVRT